MATAVGLALGAIPLIISALEYYPQTKKMAKQVWAFRSARTTELLHVERCRAQFSLHLLNLLSTLRDEGILDAKELEVVSQEPGTFQWSDSLVEAALYRRLAGNYTTYLGMLTQVELLMVKLLELVEVDHVAFKDYVASQSPRSSNTQSNLERISACFRRVLLQGQITGHALRSYSRDGALKSLESSIEQLKQLLAAADLVNGNPQIRKQSRKYGVHKSLRTFWLRAENIWVIIQDQMKCQCRRQHCARLVFTKGYNLQESMDLVFLFDKKHPEVAAPWKRQTLRIRDLGENCSCGSNVLSVQGTGASPVTALPVTAAPAAMSTLATSGPATSTGPCIGDRGICTTLLDHGKGFVCLGAVHSRDDNRKYHFIADQDATPSGFVPLSASLQHGFRPAFRRIARLKVAATIAAAHMRYYHTPWLPDRWSLDEIYFPRDNAGATQPAYDLPYILADFSTQSANQTQPGDDDDIDMDAEAQGFWTLGVVLLELCFGQPLESHELWNTPGSNRDPSDPLHRKAIAVEWAKEVEFEVEGPQYSGAVKWCLSHAPTYVRDDKWRDDFVSNVLGPLQDYARTIS